MRKKSRLVCGVFAPDGGVSLRTWHTSCQDCGGVTRNRGGGKVQKDCGGGTCGNPVIPRPPRVRDGRGMPSRTAGAAGCCGSKETAATKPYAPVGRFGPRHLASCPRSRAARRRSPFAPQRRREETPPQARCVPRPRRPPDRRDPHARHSPLARLRAGSGGGGRATRGGPAGGRGSAVGCEDAATPRCRVYGAPVRRPALPSSARCPPAALPGGGRTQGGLRAAHHAAEGGRNPPPRRQLRARPAPPPPLQPLKTPFYFFPLPSRPAMRYNPLEAKVPQ